jgi:hypothetical protein
MITVVYGVDIFGDHMARPSRIIDTERRMFATLQEAIHFSAECTEVVNEEEIHKTLKLKMGANTLDLPEDESLLLNKAEFSKYRENY